MAGDNYELGITNGKWKMENGKWKMENGKWKMENGKIAPKQKSKKSI
jgi:hypothetical protein